MREHVYQRNFQVNSTNCVINYKRSYLAYYDTYYRKIMNYTNETVVLDNAKTGQLYINTTNATYVQLFLVVKTNTSAPFYLPLNVRITQYPTEKFNTKPIFMDPDDLTFNFSLNYFTYTYFIQIPISEQWDDHNELAWLNFSNSDLGDLSIKYDRISQVPAVSKVRKDYLSYNMTNHTLAVKIEGGPDGVRQMANVIYRIKTQVEDYLGLKSQKMI